MTFPLSTTVKLNKQQNKVPNVKLNVWFYGSLVVAGTIHPTVVDIMMWFGNSLQLVNIYYLLSREATAIML